MPFASHPSPRSHLLPGLAGFFQALLSPRDVTVSQRSCALPSDLGARPSLSVSSQGSETHEALHTLIRSHGPTQPESWLLQAQNLTYRKRGDATVHPNEQGTAVSTWQVAHAREEALKWEGGTEREGG